MQTQELQARYGLSLRQQACLAVRSSPQTCSRCAEACPAGIVTVSMSGVSVGEGCLGCGRCAAACPTGALHARAYAFPDELPSGNRDLLIECWKVSSQLLDEGSVAVPCLGGITAAALLERVLTAGESRRVVLVDRGGCKSCRAGGADHPPVAAQLEFARQTLLHLGWPEQMLPVIRRDPLPATHLADAIPSLAEREALGRRDFFRVLAGKVANAVIEYAEPETPPHSLVRHRAEVYPERIRLLLILEKLAGLRGVPLPAGLFASISISSGSCANHGVCAGVCPTGALRTYASADSAGIQFEPWLCTACGLCARSCPEGALQLLLPQLPIPSDMRPMEYQMYLTDVPWQECPSCFSRFASRVAGMCPRCKKNRRMAADLFGTRYAETGAYASSSSCSANTNTLDSLRRLP